MQFVFGCGEFLGKVIQLFLLVELINGNKGGSIKGAFLSYLFHRGLQNSSRVIEFNFWKWGENIGLMIVLFALRTGIFGVLDAGVDPSFRNILDPLPDKDLVLEIKEIAPLSLALIVDPVSLKVVAVLLGHDAVPAALPQTPEPLVDIPVLVDHPSGTVRLVVHPEPIVTVPVLVEHCPAPSPLVVDPVPSVLTTQLLFTVVYPQCPLTISHVVLPTPLVTIFINHCYLLFSLFFFFFKGLTSICVVLDTKTTFHVVLPIANVFHICYPFLTFK